MLYMEWIRFTLAFLLMGMGTITLVGATIGLFRFTYVLNRIHVSALCDTFGLLLIFASLMLMHGLSFASLKLFLIILFLWVANPVAGHLIAHLEVTTNPQEGIEYEVVRHDVD